MNFPRGFVFLHKELSNYLFLLTCQDTVKPLRIKLLLQSLLKLHLLRFQSVPCY